MPKKLELPFEDVFLVSRKNKIISKENTKTKMYNNNFHILSIYFRIVFSCIEYKLLSVCISLLIHSIKDYWNVIILL